VNTGSHRWLSGALALALAGLLAACGSSPRPKPADLGSVPVQQDLQKGWSFALGALDFPMSPAITANLIGLATSQGTVHALDARNGQEVWRATVGAPLSAGVGSDGERFAVVTRGNELVTLQSGKVLWRQKLPAQSFTPPLVAGQRVFVLMADRSVMGLDGATGRILWTQQRPGEPLVLRQAGVLLPVNDTLVAGLSGRLVGLNPTTGALRWDAPLATPRGTNDLERLVDIVAPVSRVGDSVCARAFLAQVGCVNAARGGVQWTRAAVSDQGLSGNANLMVGTESNGVVTTWQRSNGERLWETDRLRYRRLSAPLVTEKGVLVADEAGFIYLLSLTDGALLNRITLDGEALISAPQAMGNGFLMVSRKGLVQSLRFP
jgi:outer membrane protein assembly factor BamB